MENARGIDVSHHVFITDIKGVVAAGYSFVGIKATQGLTFVDPRLAYHRDLVRGEPGIVGSIYYHYPNKQNDPAKEAAACLSAIGPLRVNERVALDVEEGESGNDHPPIGWQQEFVAELTGLPVIYTSKHDWNEIGDPPWADATVGKIALWLKRYAPDYGPCPSPWSFPTLWQKSQAAVIPGVSAPCDLNEFCLGDVDALRAWFAGAPAF